MNLRDLAHHTLNIEYPGRSMEEAFAEATARVFMALDDMKALTAKIHALRYSIGEAERAYYEAVGSANLFQNILKQEESK